MRLNKFLATAGVASRRKSDELIRSGTVKINGRIETEPWYDVSDEDSVVVSGKIIKPVQKYLYVLLNKPKGTVSTTSDEKDRTTVVSLIGISTKLFPVGRLDYNTTGVLLCTTDDPLPI